jgi:hypothetical protein
LAFSLPVLRDGFAVVSRGYRCLKTFEFFRRDNESLPIPGTPEQKTACPYLEVREIFLPKNTASSNSQKLERLKRRSIFETDQRGAVSPRVLIAERRATNADLIETIGNGGVSASPPPFSATKLFGMFVFDREHNGQNSRKK